MVVVIVGVIVGVPVVGGNTLVCLLGFSWSVCWW